MSTFVGPQRPNLLRAQFIEERLHGAILGGGRMINSHVMQFIQALPWQLQALVRAQPDLYIPNTDDICG